MVFVIVYYPKFLMNSRTAKLLKLITVYASAGWLAGTIVSAEEGAAGISGALIHVDAMRGGFIGALSGLFWGELSLRVRSSVVSAAFGIPAMALGVLTYFIFWPTSWNISPAMAAFTILSSYWYYLLPVALLTGAMAEWWVAHTKTKQALDSPKGTLSNPNSSK